MDTTRKNCSKSGCQKSMLKSDCKVCSVCRKVTYCSRECQKADWPIHKPTCDAGGSLSVPSVTLQIVREAIDRDKELMSDIDMIAAAALQLHNFPERARTHTVILFCRMESGETGPLKDDIRAKLDNWRTADKIPTTFQLSRAEAWPETQLKPPIREKINAEFMAFVNEFFKRGILPSDNVMPFRIVWTFDTPSGNIVTHAVLVYRVFFRQNMASLRHIFDEYAVDGCLNALVNNFNRKLIADPKRMDKLSAIFRNVNSTLERVPLTTPVTIFCTNPACEKPMTKSEGKFCSACKLNMYCSRECQKAHWCADPS
ncbi:hypothetical protein BD410DRAFT_322262 [Rickenella mellea]|uniref:phytol kinase n=1 Tax=Rickenella mellea TaxID=50990 RepID=A0A4Y7Q0Y5_9AGAM|nr:hypothetical protein BD410DRAFT_322262 [Rickenella mellea]